MRLFVAVDLDDASREAIGAEQTRLRRALDAEGRPAWKWVRLDRMHLTLVFIGEVDAPAAEALDRGGAIARIDVRAVSVYQSRLSPAGPDYTTLVRTELRS
jgi:2'-5' RNA ligase